MQKYYKKSRKAIIHHLRFVFSACSDLLCGGTKELTLINKTYPSDIQHFTKKLQNSLKKSEKNYFCIKNNIYLCIVLINNISFTD